jgi:hypothetical protein
VREHLVLPHAHHDNIQFYHQLTIHARAVYSKPYQKKSQEIASISLFLQMEKLRHGDCKWFPQSHKTSRWQGQDSVLDMSDPGFIKYALFNRKGGVSPAFLVRYKLY